MRFFKKLFYDSCPPHYVDFYYFEITYPLSSRHWTFPPNHNSWNYKTNKHKNSCYIITFMGDRQGFLFFLFIYQSPISLGIIVCKNKLYVHTYSMKETLRFFMFIHLPTWNLLHHGAANVAVLWAILSGS